MFSTRVLNDKQHRALDRLTLIDPEAIVFGWDNEKQGPLVFTSERQTRAVSKTGYLVLPSI